MFQGFYNLASGMLTQTRNLDVISNNMVNISTPGFKKDTLITTSFQEEMMYRLGNKDKSNPASLGTSASKMNIALETFTDYTQGAFKMTDDPLDFALGSPGFFQIQQYDGETTYTRNGSFFIDNEGYLALQGVGRVIGENGPIQLNVDDIQVDPDGTIYDAQGERLDQLAIADFEDYNELKKTDYGTYTSEGQPADAEDVNIQWKAQERSNVDSVEVMTAMMTSQRQLQSGAQILKMYDQLMGKATTQIGSLT